MDGYFYTMMYGYPFGYPIAGMLIWIFIIWVIQLIIGYLVHKDAKERGMNTLLWFILVILPMIGWLFLLIYVIIREPAYREPGKKESAKQILDERFAKGEITSEQYRQMKEEMKK